MILDQEYKAIEKPDLFKVLGVGLLRVINKNPLNDTEILFQIGIGNHLLNKILKIHKKKIIEKREGILIDLICNFTVYLHFFENLKNEIIVFVYLDKKENIISFSDLFSISKSIFKSITDQKKKKEMRKIYKNLISINQTEGVLAILIIGTTGHLYFSKINAKKTKFADCEDLISGFITAILTFSKEIIENEPGVKLKKIHFGNRHFLVNTIDEVIFAFLIEEENSEKINRRYLHLISEEFLDRYRDYVKEFNGNASIFFDFKEIVDQYFII